MGIVALEKGCRNEILVPARVLKKRISAPVNGISGETPVPSVDSEAEAESAWRVSAASSAVEVSARPEVADLVEEVEVVV